jgi:hypothetical protein
LEIFEDVDEGIFGNLGILRDLEGVLGDLGSIAKDFEVILRRSWRDLRRLPRWFFRKRQR